MALSDFQTLVTRLVRDGTGQISTDDRDGAIAAALAQYSRDVPRQVVEDITWAAASHFQAAPDDLAAGGDLLACEQLPAAVPALMVDMALYLTVNAVQLMSTMVIGAGTALRLTYTAAHRLDATHDTVPTAHREAVCSFAAHLLCRQLAAYFSGEREASISADGSNTESRARNYALRSRDYRGAYFSLLGIVDPQADAGGGSARGAGSAASAVVSWGSRNREWLRTNAPMV